MSIKWAINGFYKWSNILKSLTIIVKKNITCNVCPAKDTSYVC